MSSAAGGFFGSLGVSGFGAIAGGGQVFFGAFSGGIGAELTGGNFWQGVVIGGIVAGLNHVAHMENKTQKSNNDPPVTEIKFDGKYLRIYRDGKEVFRLKAVSGRAQKDGSFDYSISNQKNKGVGPIPEGGYTINPSEIQYTGNRTIVDAIKGIFGRGTFPSGVSSWGYGRVWISPDEGTNVYGRSGFTIHGGKVYGSAGCIDLGPHSKLFFKVLMKFKSEGQRSVSLNVKY